MIVAVVLILGGLTVAIVNDATPGYRVSSLALSGSFFALASSGDTLYAASDNGGSILLEESTDRGIDWAANPVPYAAVAGGAPWDYAAVAVDGTNVVLAAATGGGVPYSGYPGYSPNPGYPTVGFCGSNSTILVASSPDGGRTWRTLTFPTDNLSVTSLQAGIEGRTAAVAWLGETTACGLSIGSVGALSSRDAGQTWSAMQHFGTSADSVPAGGGLEMAPEDLGIMVGFRVTSLSGATNQLSLWQLADTGAGGFGLVTEIPAPSSWTLQGDAGTPAYLLTPTYLIPLVSPPYTAIPFNELQRDGGGIGLLPRVVALVATGPTQVEIAATTSDNLGVDCWQVDTTPPSVAQSCHVPIGSSLLSASLALPIVALIDGGGWWIAIGASGNGCYPACPGYGGYPGTPGPPVSAGASVGTSVCITGCSSSQGLTAYSYSPDSSSHPAALNVLAALLSGTGLVLLFATAWSNRRRSAAAPSATPLAPISGEGRTDADPLLRPVRRTYLAGLAVWVLLWVPLSVLVFVPGSGLEPASSWTAIALGGIVGAVVGFPLHHIIRQRLQRVHGIFEAQLLGKPPVEIADYAFDRVRLASYFAYASWAAGVAVIVALWATIIEGRGTGGSYAYGAASNAPSPAALALLLVLAVFLALRFLYHLGIERAVSASPPTAADRLSPPGLRRGDLRIGLGAALLPCNPLVGLILGVALQPVLPWSAFFLAWAFLPITLLGVALLTGLLGKTAWTPRLLTA